MKKIMTGNMAIAEGVKLARVNVVSAFPITPQTSVVEYIAQMKAKGLLACEFINTESEQSAMAIVHGATLAGKRAFTVTSSHGLFYMYEMLYAHTSLRLPLVFGNVTRAMGMPFAIWSDWTDALSLRDFPAIQFFCASAQEVLDHILLGYKLAEQTYFTAIVNYEGFYVSHTAEPVDIPDQDLVDKFLPVFQPRTGHFIDFNDSPKTFVGHDLMPDSEFYELFRKRAFSDLSASKAAYKKISDEFAEMFGRKYLPIETYKTEDAEIALVTLGVIAHTAKVAIDELRREGIKCGLIRILMFRPFPAEEILANIGSSVKTVIVLESDNTGVFFSEIRAALYGREKPKVFGSIIGICGREITPEILEKIINDSKDRTCELQWEEY